MEPCSAEVELPCPAASGALPPVNPIRPLNLEILILLFDDKLFSFSIWQGWKDLRQKLVSPSCQSNLTSDPAMSPHVSITTPPPPTSGSCLQLLL